MYINRVWKQLTGKKEDTKPTDATLRRLLLPSFFGIVLCMACVTGLTWAWFSMSISSTTQTITAANFSINVEVVEQTSDANMMDVLEDIENGVYELKAGKTYQVTLTAYGTALNGGYCVIETESGETYFTEHIALDESFELTIHPAVDDTYTFIGVWGTHVEDDENTDLEDSAVISDPDSLANVEETEEALEETEETSNEEIEIQPTEDTDNISSNESESKSAEEASESPVEESQPEQESEMVGEEPEMHE